jgi:hypothetical protein
MSRLVQYDGEGLESRGQERVARWIVYIAMAVMFALMMYSFGYQDGARYCIEKVKNELRIR